MAAKEVWTELTTKGTKINWCLVAVDGGNLVKVGSGDGGVKEFVSKLDSKKVMFGGIRVEGSDDRGNVQSVRQKYVAITFVGDEVKGIAKNKSLQFANEVKNAFNGAAVHQQFDSAADLTTKSLLDALLAAGGAHKPTFYDFGGGEKIALDFYEAGSEKALLAAVSPKGGDKPAPAAAAPKKEEPKAAPAPAAAAPKAAPAAAAPKKEAAAAPAKNVQHNENAKRWIVENLSQKDQEPVVISPSMQESVLIENCNGGVVQIKGKCKVIMVVRSSKAGVVFDDVISGFEMTGCKSMQVQVTGECKLFQVDKSERINIFLSKASMSAELYTCQTAAININHPTADGEDMVEMPVPEQIRLQHKDGKLHAEAIGANH